MEHPTKDWKIERICSSCGHTDKLLITKRQTAFELVKISDVLGNTCSRCRSTTFTTANEMPDLDFDLLKEWATDPELYLMEQDEELLLVDKKYLDMILQVLDTIPISEHKRNVLLDALCVIVYDNTVERNPKGCNKLRSRVIEELNKRQEMLKLADGFIMDYFKVVYPQLALGRPNAV